MTGNMNSLKAGPWFATWQIRMNVWDRLQMLHLVCPEANVAAATAGMLQESDGFLRPRACLARDVDRRARLMLREKGFNLRFAERDQSCAAHLGAGTFWRCADIQQIVGIAGA